MTKKLLLAACILLLPLMLFAVPGVEKAQAQYLYQAGNMFEIGKYSDAVILYDTVLIMDKDSVEAYAGKGNCYMLMGKDKLAKEMYDKAKLIDPAFKEPNLSRYFEIAKQRGRNNDKIKEKYYSLFGKGAKTASEETPIVDDKAAAKEETPSVAAQRAEEPKEWWSKGGKAKMTSLGGIKHVYPDLSTAMDGASRGIEAGLLFRRDKHFFQLQPFVGKYNHTIKAPGGAEFKEETFAADINDSFGEVGWPNKFFMISIKPYYMNSFTVNSKNDYPGDSRYTNTGNMFGGMYLFGFKPIPLFGIAGRAGYKYVPYQQSNDSEATVIISTELSWNASAGLYLPYLFMPTDELDITASVGSYSPTLNLEDIMNRNMKGLPDSLLYSYNKKYTKSKPLDTSMIDPSLISLLPGVYDSVRNDVSTIVDTTGYNVKGNIHYMAGNGQHEFFAYVEAPVNLEYKANTTDEINVIIFGAAQNVTRTTSEKVRLGNGRKLKFETGIRNNLLYVIPGVRYSYDYDETYTYMASMISEVGRLISKKHSIIAGASVTPVEQLTVPLEFEYGYRAAENLVSGVSYKSDTTEFKMRGGIEVKPLPVAAIRGGISYEFIRNDGQFTRFDGSYNNNTPSGQQGNPFINCIGYYAGGGFDMPFFELNAGGAYKRLYPSPALSGATVDYEDFLYGFIDLNIYI